MKSDIKHLRDFFLFAPEAGREGGPSSDPSVRRQALAGKALKVTWRASHAGMRNGNYVMYSPAGMKNSLHTWTYPHNRPVQIHHDDHADPIGRVIGARYVPFEAPSAPGGDALTAARLFDEAVTPSDMVDAANMLDEAGVLDQETWKGVGELQVDAIITDAAAIEKILDGRYLMVSISQRPKTAYCSKCKKDWVKSGPCDHERGVVDEETGRPNFVIVGDTRYGEISPVNHPADEHAGPESMSVVEIEGVAIQMDKLTVVPSSLVLVDALEDEFDHGALSQIRDDAALPPEPAPVVAEPPVVVPPEAPPAEVVPPVVAVVEDSQPAPEPPKQEEQPAEEDPPLSETVAEAMRILFNEPEDSFTEAHAEIINEAIEAEILEQDAKLSTEKRKALPGSSFCGPKKSFPVPDCAHYTAALRMIGRYKGPGDKGRIRSCVMGKGKKLGCDGSEDSLKTAPVVECLTGFTSDELIMQHGRIEEILASRQIEIPRPACQDCATKDQRIAELQGSTAQTDDLTRTLALVREDWRLLQDEYVGSAQAHQESLAELESCLRTMLITHSLMTDKESSPEDIRARVDAMAFDALRQEAGKISFDEAIAFVRSGMTRQPVENVEISDAVPEEVRTIEQPSGEVLELARKILSVRSSSGKASAENYISQLIRRGKLPLDFTLYKAEGLVAK